MIKIAISTPTYGQMFYTAYVRSLFRLVRTLDQRQWPSSFAAISYADIVESRNFLLILHAGSTRATPRTSCSSTRIWASARSSSST